MQAFSDVTGPVCQKKLLADWNFILKTSSRNTSCSPLYLVQAEKALASLAAKGRGKEGGVRVLGWSKQIWEYSRKVDDGMAGHVEVYCNACPIAQQAFRVAFSVTTYWTHGGQYCIA